MKRQQRKKAFLTKFIFVSVIGAGLVAASRLTFASEPGTVGVAVNQLYTDPQPTKRGALIVRHVDPNSAAADAGIQAGDLILAADGKRVFNIELNELIKRLAGPAGSSIELSVVQADGNLKKITLIRRPYAPHVNPQRMLSAIQFRATGKRIRATTSRFPGAQDWRSKDSRTCTSRRASTIWIHRNTTAMYSYGGSMASGKLRLRSSNRTW